MHMEDPEDIFSKIESIAEQIMRFVVRLTCTAALLVFRPFRSVPKLFKEDGQLNAGYVQPVAFAVLASFFWFVCAQLLTSKALTSFVFSHDRLMTLYQRMPHEFSLFDMVMSVGPMLVFIYFAAQLVIRVLGAGGKEATCFYRIVLFACSAQCLAFPFAYLFHLASLLWRLLHIQPGAGPGIHYSPGSQFTYWGANGLVFAYLLIYPGILLTRGLRLGKAGQRPRTLWRSALALVLICGVAGPGFIALGAGTSAFKALFQEKEKEISLTAMRSDFGQVIIYGTNKFSFNIDLVVRNETADPIWLRNSDLTVDLATEKRERRSFPTIYFEDGADHPRTTRLLGPGQATWFSIRLENTPRNLGFKSRGDHVEFNLKFSLTSFRFLRLDQGKGLPESEPLKVEFLQN